MDTEEKTQRLKQIVSYYESFLNLSNDAIFVVNNKMEILDASKRFCDICGIGRKDIIGTNVESVVFGKEKENTGYLIKLLSSCFQNKKTIKQSFNYSETGKQYYFEINASLINDDTASSSVVICSMKDITELKSAKNIAFENKRKLKTLFDNLNGFAYRCLNDENWTMEFVSAAFSKISGYPVSDIINNDKISYNDLIIPEDRERIWQEVQEAIEKKQAFDLNYRIKTVNGKIIDVEEQGVGVFDEKSGQLLVLEGYIKDVSLRVKEHNALLRSENINHSINQTAVDAIITVNNKGIVILWNNAATKTFGYSPKEIIGKSVEKIIPEKYKKMHEAGVARLNEGGKERLIGKLIEISAINKEGKEFPVELSLSKWKIGDDKHYTAIIRDISERKESEAKLIKLSTAVEQSPAVIMITDTNGDIEYVNPKFCELTGYEKDEAIGQNPRFLKSGTQTDEFYENFWETITSGKTWSGEVQNRKKSGELFWEKVSVSPIIDEMGQIINYLKVAEDINQQKMATLNLKKSEEKYRRLIETTSEGFWLIDTNSISIDANSSLCKMLGYSKEEILGKTPFDFVDDDNLKIFKQQIARNRIDKPRVYEISLKRKTEITSHAFSMPPHNMTMMETMPDLSPLLPILAS